MPGRATRGPDGPDIRRGRGSTSVEVVAPSAPLTLSDDFPEVVLEWMPDGKPNDVDGTWETLTPYLFTGTCRRGRKYELDRFVAGTMTFTLRVDPNRDGVPGRIFDREYAAGIYYGKLRSMKQVRLRIWWEGVWYPVWRGYVTSWGTAVKDGALWVSTVTCRDAFERLERIKLPSSPWALTVRRQNPLVWFRLGESGTTRATDVGSAGAYGIYEGVTQGQAGLVPGDGDGSILLDRASNNRVRVQNSGLTSLPFTFSCMFQMTDKVEFALTSPNATLFAIESENTSRYLQVRVDGAGVTGSSGQVSATYNPAGTSSTVATTTNWDDLEAHHLAVVFTTSGIAIYVDGSAQEVSTTGSVSTAWFTDAVRSITIGNTSDELAADNRYAFPGYIDEATIWNRALAADEIATLAAAAKSAWAGDDTGARVTRLLDALDWPDEMRDISPGISILQAASWSAGASALSVMQTWADTELGAFFPDPEGNLVWRSRHYPLLDVHATQPQALFGDGTSSAPIKYLRDQCSLVTDENLVRNPVTASRRNGVTVTVSDDELVANETGDRTHSLPQSEDLYDAVVRDRAVWALNRWKREKTRLAGMTVDLRSNIAQLPTLLTLELGYRINVEQTPGQDVAVAGASHVRLDGSSGCYVSTPDSAAVSITGDLDIRIRVAMDDWTPSGDTTLVCKESGSSSRSYRFRVTTSGAPDLVLSANGSSTTIATSTAATGFTGGDTKWVRATWRQSDGRVQFFTAADSEAVPTSWTQLGSDRSAVIASIFDSSSPVEIGSLFGGTIQLLTGSVYRVQILNGIDGTTAADFDPRMQTASPFSSGDATWTLNGTAALAVTPITTDQIIESITHAFAPKLWRIGIEGSPPDPNVGSYLILDDETAGLLDTGLLAY